MTTATPDREARLLFTAGIVIGLLVGFAAALLAPGRFMEKKPATEARMRPPVDNVRAGEDVHIRRRQRNGERRWVSSVGSAER